MNLPALDEVDPDDLTPDQRVELFGVAVLERERRELQQAEDAFADRIQDVPVRPG